MIEDPVETPVLPPRGFKNEEERRLHRLNKKVALLNTWEVMKYGPQFRLQLMTFVEKRRLTRTKKHITIRYGLSVHGSVPQVGPMSFEEMTKYLNEQVGIEK